MYNLYELYQKRSKYNAIRENVNNAINVLSRVNVDDNFDKAIYSLENSYIVNDVACKKNEVRKAEQSVSNSLSNLRSILSSVNAKINMINRQIHDLEMSQNM